jgi:pimeloyl-ACP methyl ester carboxylesterase
MKELTYQSPLVTLNYAEGPNNGTPLLMLHGNMSRWQALSPLIPECNKNTHVYALDLRGHGKSTHVHGAYTLQDHLQDVLSFVNEKVKEPVIILGISLGGMIGLLAAAHYPEIIKGLIVFDSPLSKETLFPIVKSQQEMGDRVIQYLKNRQIEQLYQEINDDFTCESFLACDPGILETTFHNYETMIKGYELDALFPLIQCPLLIMRGEAALGSMVTDKDVEQAIKLAPHIKHNKIDGVGHSLLEKKDIVINEAIKFMNKYILNAAPQLE